MTKSKLKVISTTNIAAEELKWPPTKDSYITLATTILPAEASINATEKSFAAWTNTHSQPFMNAGKSKRSVMRQKVCRLPAPLVCDTSSNSLWICRTAECMRRVPNARYRAGTPA